MLIWSKRSLSFQKGLLSILIFITFVFFLSLIKVHAAGSIYFVATNGSDSNPGTINRPWLTIAKANQTLQAGDAVYIRGGSYKEGIAPARSGTQGARIIYKNYNGEKVTISNVNEPLILSNRSYITIHGIEFRNVGTYLTMLNGDYNFIEYCTFTDSTNWGWRGMDIDDGSTHNWFHHNSISGHGEFTGGEDLGDMIWLDGKSDYNLFENNIIFHGGHSPFAIRTSYNVIRNNYFHDEVWKSGYGNRNMNLEQSSTTRFNLIEGNRFAFAGIPNDTWYSDGIQHAVSDTIYRYNAFYENSGNGLKITTFYGNVANNNHVYNNVFFHNGVNVDPSDKNRVGLMFPAWDTPIVDNVVKNNIFYRNLGGAMMFRGNASASDQTIENNWESGDPLFVDDESPLDPFNPAFPDFHLQAGSPAIDAGIHLTVAVGPGSGTSLVVDDADYFSDGFGIVDADWIKIGSSNPVQISSIDYNNETITLASARIWSGGNPVYLYRNSSGTIVLQGSAPDVGAYEYGGTTPGVTPAWLATPTFSPPPPADNLILNHSFEEGSNNWSFHTDGIGSFIVDSSDAYKGSNSAQISISQQGSNVQLYQFNISLEPDTRYSLSFTAKSNTGHNLSVYVHEHDDDYTNYGLSNYVANLTSNWQTFSTEFTTPRFDTAVNDARLRFWLAPYDAAEDEYLVDNVVLKKASPGVPGDANRDGNVDGLDYIIWLNHYNQSTNSGSVDGDFDNNGKVDGSDYVIWLTNYEV